MKTYTANTINPEHLYPVSYTVKQDGTKVYENTFLLGKDMTANQIEMLNHFDFSPSPQVVKEEKEEGVWNEAEIRKWLIKKGLESISVSTPKESLTPDGWIFNGRFFKDISELQNKTMSDSNTPQPVYFAPSQKEEVKDEKRFTREQMYECWKSSDAQSEVQNCCGQLDTAEPNIKKAFDLYLASISEQTKTDKK
jgi:hypothetical protein